MIRAESRAWLKFDTKIKRTLETLALVRSINGLYQISGATSSAAVSMFASPFRIHPINVAIFSNGPRVPAYQDRV